MSNDKEKIGIAMVGEACPLCGHVEESILLNTVLSEKKAEAVKEMHGKTIGYLPEPCKECQDLMKQGILLIGIVEAKTPDIKDPYRSGNKWVVREDFIKRCFEPELADAVIKKRASYISVEAAHKMGFPDCNINA